jgi:CHRD domain
LKNTKVLLSTLAMGAIGTGLCACNPNAATSAGQTPPSLATTTPAAPSAATGTGSLTGSGSAAGSGSGLSSGLGEGSADMNIGPGAYILKSMPTGAVALQRGTQGQLLAHVTMFGLTPGSSHDVEIDGPDGQLVRFPPLTASGAGQADTTLTSVNSVGKLPYHSKFVIRLGASAGSGDSGGNALAMEPIAESGGLPRHPDSEFALHGVTVDTNGVSFGQPAGRTTITFNAAAQTLTVTVTASGLNPGSHAAHIHLGSCQSQGAVKYMLPDFVADANGDVVDQTRVVTGVTSVPGPGSWYLNLHQGSMNQILANGAPTLSFRPMLCTNITSFARTGGTPSATPTPTAPASSPSMTAPTSTPTSLSPTGDPTGQPTHW